MSLLQKSSLSLALIAMLNGCQPDVGSNQRAADPDGVVSLRSAVAVYDGIHTLGQVNWYAYEMNADSPLLAVDIDSATQRADVDLLATLYRKNAAGELERLYADHATEGSVRGSKIQLVYPFEQPETVYIAVRDLLDDEASDSEYRIKVSETIQDTQDNSFEGARMLSVNNPEQCASDRIDSMGDIDTYQFTLNSPAVTHIASEVTAPNDSPLRLQVKLFDGKKQFIRSTTWLKDDTLSLYENLSAGQYFVTVEDYGRDHFDLSARYSLCVNYDTKNSAANDDSAEKAQPISSNEAFKQGQLAYAEDTDWYKFTVSGSSANAIPLLAFTMQANTSSQAVSYQLLDDQGNVAFSFEQPAGSAEVSHQIKVSDGSYQLQVSTDDELKAPVDYGFQVLQSEVFDTDELAQGNNRIETATQLSLPDSGIIDGKISYLADIDWYQVEIPLHASRYQRLAIRLSGEQTELIDYQLQVVEDEVTETLVDPIHDDALLDIGTSLLIAPDDTNSHKRIYFKVSDQFARKSESAQGYQIQVQLADLVTRLPNTKPSQLGNTAVVYADETSEQNQLENNSAPRLNIEHNGYVHKNYAANTDTFKFRDPTHSAAHVTRQQQGDKTIIQFPWVAGYIDYAHDQDWFEFDFKALGELIDEQVEYGDDKWVYNLSVELVAAASDVEYQWRMYRDGGNNLIIRDRKNTNDGFFAANGDKTLAADFTEIATSQADTGNTFYVGSRWNNKIYLSVLDANYVRKPSDKKTNERNDVDWSDDSAPYYVRVTLEYIAGQDQP